MPLEGPDVLLYEKKDHIVTITINRPERMNALTLELYDRLDEAWEQFNEDDDALVAIWTAAGDLSFCDGMDLKYQADRVAKDPSFDIVKLKPGVLDGTVGTPYGHNITKPIVGAINGMAAGAGLQLTMMCDLRIASEHAFFNVGVNGIAKGTPWAIPMLWQMPPPIYFELFIKGDWLPAQRLYDVGWINEVVLKEDLMITAMQLATVLTENAPLSIRAAKEALYKTMDVGLKKGLEEAKKIYIPVYNSEDAVEGLRAYKEKRKPIWKGK